MANIPIGKILKLLGGSGLLFGAGMGVDHLINKYKMDDLQKQVVTLQKDNAKLISLLEDRDNQIDKLILKNKIAALSSALSEYEDDDLRIILKYALKDYVDIYMKISSGDDIYESDLLFFKAMEKFIEGRPVRDEDMVQITNRVKLRYGSHIEGNVEPSFDSLIRKLKEE